MAAAVLLLVLSGCVRRPVESQGAYPANYQGAIGGDFDIGAEVGKASGLAGGLIIDMVKRNGAPTAQPVPAAPPSPGTKPQR